MCHLHDNSCRQVGLSSSAGLYLCNYIYFHSLARGLPAVFVHIPPLDAMALGEQVKYLERTLEHLLRAVP